MTALTNWISVRDGGATFVLSGDWSIANGKALERAVADALVSGPRPTTLDLSGIGRLDTVGAWLVTRLRREIGDGIVLVGVRPEHGTLIERLADVAGEAATEPDRRSALSALAEITGRATYEVLGEARDLLNFLGLATATAFRLLARPARIRYVSLVSHIETVGLHALPIVGLLAFLIGVVLAYQGADQLRRFGAEIYTVNLIVISMLREMGILMTAIIIAGRSGSAFTAQIGTMQVNEEIDAMRTIGLDPVEVLVLPRAFALIVALPLLTVYADLMGIAGGMLMSHWVLDISFVQFIERVREIHPVWPFWVGIIKAPVFGFVIALVGCREGLKVRGSAESVGRQTTKSVVVSIFLVMTLDALFSIFFSAVRV
jgi:phospholipid/cholesterol/gamma-HCH transport system permease protein